MGDVLIPIPEKSDFIARHEKTAVDSMLFFAVFAVGLAIIYLFNTHKVPHDLLGTWELFVRVLLPCLLLVAYALIIGFVKRFQLKTDQAGDNCYYLGFLFTLISLAFALSDFVEGGDRTLIVQDFGIALSTTISGLLLRVIFSQARLDPVNVESAAREELSKSARALRTELNHTIVDLNHFRRSVEQSISDALHERQKSVSELQTELIAYHVEAAEVWTNSINDVSVAFNEKNQELNSAIESAARTFKKFAEQTKFDSSHLAEQRVSIDQVKISLSDLNQNLTVLVEMFDDELVKNFQGFTTGLGEACSALQKNREPLKATVTAFKGILKELNELEPLLSRVPKRLKDIDKTLSNLKEEKPSIWRFLRRKR